jgi:hypothetical protein
VVELSRNLFLAGAIPFIVLGVAHALATPLVPEARKGLSPSDPELSLSMLKTTVRLTRRTNMWLGWVGFNLSHGLGAVAFGSFVLLVGRTSSSFAEQASACLPLAVAVSGAYLWLALRYWFRTPIIGCAVSLGCFAASWLSFALSGR